MTTYLLACLAAAAVLPTAAGAAEVQQGSGGTDGVVVVGLSSDPRNELTLTQVGAELVVEDTAAPLTYFGNCRQESPNRVVCPMPRATALNISTSNADDSVTMRLGADAPSTDIYTRGGNDTVIGGPSVEVVRGGEGNDVITAGGGRDQVEGEAGDDRIDTRDAPADASPIDRAYRDRVLCGDGSDRWDADQVDWTQRSGNGACETINRPPSGGRIGLKTRRLEVARNRISAPVRCRAGEPCTGTMLLGEGLTVVAQGRIALRAGATGKVVLKLTRQGKAILARSKSLKVTAATTSPGSTGRQLGFVRLTLRAR